MVYTHGTSTTGLQSYGNKKAQDPTVRLDNFPNDIFMEDNQWRGLKLLLVEDGHQPSISHLLERLGIGAYEIARSEVEAIQLFRNFRPDIILFAIAIKSDKSCFNAAKTIKLESDIPIILVASNYDANTFSEIKKLKPHSFLDKPLSPMKLRQSIELALQGHAELRQLRLEGARLSFVASHALKEPIRNITSFAALLETKLGKELSEDAKTYLKYIKQGGQRMNSLIAGILENANLSHQRGQSLAHVDLNDTLEISRNLVQKEFSDRLVQVEAKHLPVVTTDPALLAFVFKNLMHNAIKFNQSPVALIKVEGEATEHWTKISFTDNGIGIEPAYHGKLFEMFSKLHPNDRYEGAGLGLYLSQKVMVNLGGKVGFFSEGEAGSTFWLLLPNRSPEMR